MAPAVNVITIPMISQSSVVISFRIANDFELHKKCRMTASDPISHVQSVAAALTKDSPFTKIVDTWSFVFIIYNIRLYFTLIYYYCYNNLVCIEPWKLVSLMSGRKITSLVWKDVN